MPLPAFVPGPIGLLHIQAIGMHPAPHLMLAARRAECHHQRAQRFRFLAFQGGTQLQRRSRRVAQDHTEGIEPYDERCPLLDRHMHALALGIASVGHDDIPWSQGMSSWPTEAMPSAKACMWRSSRGQRSSYGSIPSVWS